MSSINQDASLLDEDKISDNPAVDLNYRENDSEEAESLDVPTGKLRQSQPEKYIKESAENLENYGECEKSILEQTEENQLEIFESKRGAEVENVETQKEIKLLKLKQKSALKEEDFDTVVEIDEQTEKFEGKIRENQALLETLDENYQEIEVEFMEEEQQFIKSVREKVLRLVELESNLTIERNIYEKTEAEKISDSKQTIKNRQTNIEISKSEIVTKIVSTQQKLDEIENECRSKAEEHYSEKENLDAQISEIESTIQELEKMLIEAKSKKSDLVESREISLTEISKIKKDYKPEIEELSEIKEKYERKLEVNSEDQNELDLETTDLTQK